MAEVKRGFYPLALFKQGKLIIFGVLLAIICFAVGFFSGGRQEKAPVLSSITVENQLQQISQLATVRYSYTNMGQFENSIRGTLKTAFALAVSHPGQTLCIMALNLLPVGILLVSYRAFLMSMSVYLLLGFAVTAWLIAHFFVKMFAAFLPPAEVE